MDPLSKLTPSDAARSDTSRARSAGGGPRCPRYHSLDFWRGVACLMIVVFHATFYADTPALRERLAAGASSLADWALAVCFKLSMGVPIFFVISGYCISATADSTRRKAAPVRLYFWRRLRRIFPPFWIFLALAAVGVGITERFIYPSLFCDNVHGYSAPWSLSPVQWLGNITLTETWRHHVFGPPTKLFLQHAWTLCYEEQFYAVVGLILLISPRRFFPLAAAITAVIFLFEATPERFVPALRDFRRIHSYGFFFDGYWLYFAAGIGVYYAINYATRAGWWAVVGALAFGVAWGIYTRGASRTTSFAYGLALLALHPWDVALAAGRWSRPISWCGTMCYSLYLVHWPVTKALSHALALAGVVTPAWTLIITVPACIAASILAAWPFHLIVERRFLNQPSTARPGARPPTAFSSQPVPA